MEQKLWFLPDAQKHPTIFMKLVCHLNNASLKVYRERLLLQILCLHNSPRISCFCCYKNNNAQINKLKVKPVNLWLHKYIFLKKTTLCNTNKSEFFFSVAALYLPAASHGLTYAYTRTICEVFVLQCCKTVNTKRD